MTMVYVTVVGLVKAIGELLLKELSDSDAKGTVNEEVLEVVNAEAVSIIHSYLEGVYTLPVDVAKAPLVRTLTIDLMRVRLYVRRDPGNVPDSIKNLEDKIVSLLNKLRDRSVKLKAALSNADTV